MSEPGSPSRLRAVRALAWREVLAWIRSPRYYVLLAFYLFLQGFLFALAFPQSGAATLRQLCRELALLYCLVGPVAGASCLAGERETGELDVLLSQPVEDLDLVVGKFLGTLAVLAPLPLSLGIPAAVVAHYTGTGTGLALGSFLGLSLLGAATLSAGLMASAVATTTGGAAVLGVLLVLAFGGIGGEAGRVLEDGALSPLWLADVLFRGRLDLRPLVLFPILSAASVLAASRLVRAVRQVHRALHLAVSTLLVGLLLIALARGLRRIPYSVSLSDHLGVDAAALEALASLPPPVELYAPRPRSGTGRSLVEDWLDEIERLSAGRVRALPMTPQRFHAVLKPLGLVQPRDDGITLRAGDRIATLALDDFDIESRIADSVLRGLVAKVSSVAARTRVTILGGQGQPSPGERWTRILEAEGFDPVEAELALYHPDPGSLSPAILLGPRRPANPEELRRLRELLDAGGRLLLAVDPDSGPAAASHLEALRVVSLEGYVVAPGRSLAGVGPSGFLAVPEADHPFAPALGREALVFLGALPVRLNEGLPGAIRKALVRPPPGARWAATWEDTRPGSQWRDLPAFPPVVLAMSLEGPHVGRPWRAVVLGDADAIGEQGLSAWPSNARLLIESLAWLAERRDPVEGRRPVRVRPAISEAEATRLLHLVSSLPAALALALGFLPWFAWRRRTAS